MDGNTCQGTGTCTQTCNAGGMQGTRTCTCEGGDYNCPMGGGSCMVGDGAGAVERRPFADACQLAGTAAS